MSTQKEKAWDYALGIIKVDGLEPSPEFLELVEKEKRGEITTNDIIKTLNERYKMKEERKGKEKRRKMSVKDGSTRRNACEPHLLSFRVGSRTLRETTSFAEYYFPGEISYEPTAWADHKSRLLQLVGCTTNVTVKHISVPTMWLLRNINST